MDMHFYLHAGRIPEGYRKGNRHLLRDSRNRIATLPARRKDTGRIPEGYRKGAENNRSMVGIKFSLPDVFSADAIFIIERFLEHPFIS